MLTPTAAIPTTFADIRFRSRLEARWASFFTKLGWPWEYEPFDLNGYIPDFVLTFERGPVLVEVKPELYFKDLEKHFERIVASGWLKKNQWGGYEGGHEALVVGARLFDGEHWGHQGLGLSSDCNANALITRCPDGTFGFCSEIGSYQCRVCGHYDGNPADPVDVRRLWAEAQNANQWRGR